MLTFKIPGHLGEYICIVLPVLRFDQDQWAVECMTGSSAWANWRGFWRKKTWLLCQRAKTDWLDKYRKYSKSLSKSVPNSLGLKVTSKNGRYSITFLNVNPDLEGIERQSNFLSIALFRYMFVILKKWDDFISIIPSLHLSFAGHKSFIPFDVRDVRIRNLSCQRNYVEHCLDVRGCDNKIPSKGTKYIHATRQSCSYLQLHALGTWNMKS